ncbi:HPF/RaiA family ribosome-associated protein [Nocardia sp. NBC_01503]|uniref:sigma 54 modulation/S30EA ribosomal C-terminal domain-containing protein n=1 Tax=Nocardia sp. NBC_01503 TaxID=2975997 RepID=UPI002E7AD2B2|nr:sigma 54 modulation/S30EA ribosomal C-terminal domain-containing protein [Nocardia sp. NBC_01503]WTL29082.1 HPF/RaiA family ribosome-associated protein [Nocardia sp. NBC_01503]
MRTHTTEPDPVLRISIGRHVSAGGADYAREKIGHALDFAPEPVLSARVRLTGHRDPAAANPITAQANVNMEGRGVRVQIAAATTREAIDLLEARLEERFERLTRHWEAIRGRHSAPSPHEWRHDAPPRTPLPYFPRAAEQREVLRHKTYALRDETCEEAAFDMELMDYDFHLFTESGSRGDSVLYRRDGEYRLAQVDPRPDAVIRGSVPITISPAVAPVTNVDGAIARLELTGLPFVFFRDQDRGRGCVLYHRYDGHYGLLTPAM